MKILKWVASVVLLTSVAISTANAAMVPVPEGAPPVTVTAGNTYVAASTFDDPISFTHNYFFDISSMILDVDISLNKGVPGIKDAVFMWTHVASNTSMNLLDMFGYSFQTPLLDGLYKLTVTGTSVPVVGHPTLPYYSVTMTSAVPLPAAFWLFGSALIGFIGFSRRKAA